MRLSDTQHKQLRKIYDSPHNIHPPPSASTPTLKKLQNEQLVENIADGNIRWVRWTKRGMELVNAARKAKRQKPWTQGDYLVQHDAVKFAQDKLAKKDAVKSVRKFGKARHKLVDGGRVACGKPAGRWWAGKWTSDFPDEGAAAHGADTWHFVDCKECLKLKPESVCHVPSPDDSYDWKDWEDEQSRILPERWTAKTRCGRTRSPVETTGDSHAHAITCMDCLATVAKDCRQHARKPGGSQTTTLCGAKTTAYFNYASDSWDLVSCVDCHRIRRAEPVHPELEADIVQLLETSAVASRNSGRTMSQNECGRCTGAGVDDRCLPCAVLEHRGRDSTDVEASLQAIFGVPYEWVMDLIKGWDNDFKPELTYRTAYKIGQRLWRKHGTKQEGAIK